MSLFGGFLGPIKEGADLIEALVKIAMDKRFTPEEFNRLCYESGDVIRASMKAAAEKQTGLNRKKGFILTGEGSAIILAGIGQTAIGISLIYK